VQRSAERYVRALETDLAAAPSSRQ
jgi:hypothetical protein